MKEIVVNLTYINRPPVHSEHKYYFTVIISTKRTITSHWTQNKEITTHNAGYPGQHLGKEQKYGRYRLD
jgi:hypothetical protein